MSSPAIRPGRPRRSSRETIEDAAAELFLEQGYARTSVDHIAQRAGVSRASFFNYFAAKSDVLWVSFDDSSHRLAEELGRLGPSDSGIGGVGEALVVVAADFGPERAPWAVTEAEAMGVGEELGASGLPRFAALAAAIEHHLRDRAGYSEDEARPAAAALVSAAAVAALGWARAGSRRGSLSPRVERAIAPIVRGFEGDESR